jgi:hypothetical protein
MERISFGPVDWAIRLSIFRFLSSKASRPPTVESAFLTIDYHGVAGSMTTPWSYVHQVVIAYNSGLHASKE